MATEGDSGESGTAGDREEAISEPASDPPADSEEHCQSQSEEVSALKRVPVEAGLLAVVVVNTAASHHSCQLLHSFLLDSASSGGRCPGYR